MTILRTQAECDDASMADLLETYNAMTGKAVARFASLEIGRQRTKMAIMAATDAAGHAGVPKHSAPTAKTVEELNQKPAAPAAQPEKEATMARTPAKKAAKKSATRTPKKAAKKAATNGAGRHPAYTKVRFTEPTVPRRPQAESMRTRVLEALRKRKTATVEQLSEDVKFNSRGFVHKLVALGWAEVVGAE